MVMIPTMTMTVSRLCLRAQCQSYKTPAHVRPATRKKGGQAAWERTASPSEMRSVLSVGASTDGLRSLILSGSSGATGALRRAIRPGRLTLPLPSVRVQHADSLTILESFRGPKKPKLQV